MPRIILRRVELSGFGPYRDTVVIDLEDGLNVFSASNETGKSSLVAGIAAIIFGIPQTSDQAGFGQRRFRNWFGPRRFDGKLDFSADGVLYHIERDFDSNRISFTKEEDGKIKEICTGEHNPGARHRNTKYETAIQELFGMTDRELFEATFCLTQPLPESETLDEKLQGLLSGSGKSFDQSLDRLATELKEYTRYTGERGVTPRDLREARQLEKLTAEIEALRQAIAQEQVQVDEFEELKKRAAELNDQKQQAEKDYQSNQSVLNAMNEWQIAAERYRMCSKNRRELDNAVQNASAIKQQIIALENQIAHDFPEFINAPDATGNEIERLTNLDEAIAQLSKKEQEYTEVYDKLQAELGFSYNSDSSSLSSLERWGACGSAGKAIADVRSNRRISNEFIKRWEEDEQSRRSLAECQARLSELSVFDSYASADQELLRAPKERANQLQFELEHQKMKLAAVKQARTAAVRNTAIFSLLAAIIIGAAAYLLRAPLAAVIGLGAAGAALSWLIWLIQSSIRRNQSHRGHQVQVAVGSMPDASEPDNIEENIRQIQNEIERLASLTQPLIKRFGDLDHVKAAYLEWEKARSQEQALKTALERFETEYLKMGRIDFFDFGSTGSTSAGTGAGAGAGAGTGAGVGAGAGTGADTGADTCAGVAAANGTTGGAANVNGTSDTCPAYPDFVKELVDFARIADPSARIQRPAELADWLRTVAAHSWQNWLAEATEYEKRCQQKNEAQIRLDAHQSELAKIRQDLTQLKQERRTMSAMPVMVAVLTATADDPKLARERWQSRVSLNNELATSKSTLSGLLKAQGVLNIDGLQEKLDRANDEASDAMRKWKTLIESMPGLPGIDAADDPAAIALKLEQLRTKERNLSQVLNELTVAITQNADKLRGIQGQNPLNIAEAEQMLADLERKRDEVTDLVEAITLAHRALRESIIQYQTTYRDRLAKATSAFFAQLSGVPEEERHVELDEGFHLSVVTKGRAGEPVQLSRGAQDQLYIALRLAIAELLSGGIDLPFIFDDPFLNCDNKRLEFIRKCLANRATDQQLLLLTHRDDFSSWGRKVELAQEY